MSNQQTRRDTDDDHTLPAASITDFPDLYPRQQTRFEWSVLNLKGTAEHTAHTVNTRKLTCTCGDQAFNRDDDEGQVCKHIAAALYQAPTGLDGSDLETWTVSTLMADVRSLLDDLKGADGIATDGTTDAPASDTDASDDDAQPDDLYRTVDPSERQEGLCNAFHTWCAEAEQFNSDIDSAIVETEWVEWEDGREGIRIDTSPPWDGTYYDSDAGEWVDQDGFDAARDALRDLWNKQTDEDDEKLIEWYGDPHYERFLPESNVEEVV